jgi:hypothetical protein
MKDRNTRGPGKRTPVKGSRPSGKPDEKEVPFREIQE